MWYVGIVQCECCNVWVRVVGPAERDERGGDHGQAWAALAAQPQLVHPGDVRHLRRRPLRGARLALQPAEERQPLTTDNLITERDYGLRYVNFICYK